MTHKRYLTIFLACALASAFLSVPRLSQAQSSSNTKAASQPVSNTQGAFRTFSNIYDSFFKESATRYLYGYLPDDDWRWLKAQAWQESKLDPFAVSGANARGILQLIDGSAHDAGLDPADIFDARKNIRAGAWILRRNIRTWWPRDTRFHRLQLGWAGFNAGGQWIIRAQSRCADAVLWAGIAPCLSQITGDHALETIRYVAIIPTWYQGIVNEDNGLLGWLPRDSAIGIQITYKF